MTGPKDIEVKFNGILGPTTYVKVWPIEGTRVLKLFTQSNGDGLLVAAIPYTSIMYWREVNG